MCDRQHEHTVLMLFEGDHVWKAMHRVSANSGCAIVEAVQGGDDSGSRLIRSRADATALRNSAPRPSRCSSYQSAALRSSVRASGGSSTRTPFVEFLQDLGSCCVPIGRLDASVGDVA